MDGMENTHQTTGRGKKNDKPSNPRRVWTFDEEKILVNSLKELVTRGYKCDNGFKSGYITILESMMMNAFPGTDLKGDPHINSKIHVWKKQYGLLRQMFSGSGVGLHNSTHTIDATEDKWAALIKNDPAYKTLKNKSFSFYNDWMEIFGKDRATGEDAQTFPDIVQNMFNNVESQPDASVGIDEAGETPLFNESSQQDYQSGFRAESSSATKAGKGKKRKIVDDMSDDRFVTAMNLFCEKADSTMSEMTNQMSEVAKRVGTTDYDTTRKRESVYEILGQFDFLSIESRVRVSKYLCHNKSDMDLFFSLPDDAKAVFVKDIMMS